MRSSIAREWRVLLRGPIPWIGPLLLAAAVVLLMPLNKGFHSFWLNYDPQGDSQYFEEYYTTGIFTYTSGFLIGHLLALSLGAALVLTDYAPGRLRAGHIGPEPRRALRGKLAVAAGAGVLLALLNVALSLPLASSVQPGSPDPAQVRAAGLSFDPDLLSDPGVRLTIAVGLAMFPLLAAVGVGLGAVLGSWSRLYAVLALWWVVMIPVGGMIALRPRGGPVLLFILLLLLLPISGHVAITWGATSAHLDGEPGEYGEVAAVAALAGGLGYAILGYRLGSAILRRRLAQPARQVG